MKVRTKSGNIIDIEIQLANIPHMRERIVFYLSKMVSKQIKSGERYGAIKRSIIIAITDYKIIKENEKCHNVYTLRNQDGEKLTNLIEVNILELPKLPDENDNTDLWNWMKFLKSESEEEFKTLETKSEVIKMAVPIVEKLSRSKRMRLLQEQWEKSQMDTQDRLEGAFNDGVLEGLTKGLEEGEKKGKTEGLKEGKIEGRIEAVMTLVEKYHIKLSVAMSDVELGEEFEQLNYED